MRRPVRSSSASERQISPSAAAFRINDRLMNEPEDTGKQSALWNGNS
jgi:hypothetical protein